MTKKTLNEISPTRVNSSRGGWGGGGGGLCSSRQHLILRTIKTLLPFRKVLFKGSKCSVSLSSKVLSKVNGIYLLSLCHIYAK